MCNLHKLYNRSVSILLNLKDVLPFIKIYTSKNSIFVQK